MAVLTPRLCVLCFLLGVGIALGESKSQRTAATIVLSRPLSAGQGNDTTATPDPAVNVTTSTPAPELNATTTSIPTANDTLTTTSPLSNETTTTTVLEFNASTTAAPNVTATPLPLEANATTTPVPLNDTATTTTTDAPNVPFPPAPEVTAPVSGNLSEAALWSSVNVTLTLPSDYEALVIYEIGQGDELAGQMLLAELFASALSDATGEYQARFKSFTFTPGSVIVNFIIGAAGQYGAAGPDGDRSAEQVGL